MASISTTNTSNNTVSTSSYYLPSKAEGIVLCSVFALEALLIVAGNLLTIVLFALNKALRKKSLFLDINMAVADLLLGAVFLPFQMYITCGDAYSLWTSSFNCSFYLMFFYHVTIIIFLQSSLLSAAMMSVERFYAIYWPLKHRTLSVRAYRIVIFIVWALSITFSIIYGGVRMLTTRRNATYAFSSNFLTLLFIVCCCNIGIWRKFHHRVIAFQQQSRALLALQNKRLTKTLLFVSIVALLSWLPLIIHRSLPVTTSSTILFITNILLYSNSFVNPIVYALRIPEFRQALRLCCLKRHLAMDMKEEITGLPLSCRRYNYKHCPVNSSLSANRTLSTPVQIAIYQETNS